MPSRSSVGAIAILIIHSAVTQAVFGAAVGRGSSHRVRLATVVIGNVVVLGLGLLIVAQALVAGGFL